ncbi:hypothetical protein SO802_008961 [Lithocarpus litseifolius]|uniref:Glycosyl hydrolase family 13 catalytic domain-containing protein n=1 Tax=Lithocarpus litseifolius TaxID=425828 RepID=A0AAW2DBG3_9ROSI
MMKWGGGQISNFEKTIAALPHCHLPEETKAVQFQIVNARRESGGGVGGGAEVNTAVAVKEKPKSERFEVYRGSPTPFCATARDGGVDFAIFSANAVSATLCLISFSDLHDNKVTEQISLDPLTNKTGDVWHVFLKGDFKDMLYGYKFDGKFSPDKGLFYDSSRILLDPYAKVTVISRGEFGALGADGNCWPQMACMVPSFDDEVFDWEGDLPLKYPRRDLIIYEMHVRGFTRHESSRTEFPGTYLGVVEKLHHLKELGVNCIELMPCHEFNELEYLSYNSVLGDYKVNFWGYSTVNYFSPMTKYSSSGVRNCGHDAINEFKLLIREAHKQGIEVIMDVVFNRTAEGKNGPLLSFRGVDNSVYYMLAPKGEFYNYSGRGNTFNRNNPVVRQFIADCLRYWVTEMHVDGFRFDLASIMTRGSSLWDAVNVYGNSIEGDWMTTGSPLGSPPLIDMISNDPILHGVKVFTVDSFLIFPFFFLFLKTIIQEGELASTSVKKLRKRQMRNFFLCLMVSQGVPMIYMGDEYGHTKGGNNNTYCHDNYVILYNLMISAFNQWDKKEESSSDFFRFCCLMTKFRHFLIELYFISLNQCKELSCIECESLHLNDFPTAERLQWHGHTPGRPDWSETSRFVAYTLACFLIDSEKGEIYVAFNNSHLPVMITLPKRPGFRWEPLVDSSKPTPYDFLSIDLPGRDIAYDQYAHFLDANLSPMLSYSSIILLLSPEESS